MNILICGDSFGADCNNKSSWPNLLEKKHTVINLAECGVSQYKIYKQVNSINLKTFDVIILCNTHPYRVHTKNHPILYKNQLHQNTDLLINDILVKNSWFNRSLRAAQGYFRWHWDEEHAWDMYKLIVAEQDRILKHKHVIKIKNFEELEGNIDTTVYPIFNGPNHRSNTDSKKIYNSITELLSKAKELHNDNMD